MCCVPCVNNVRLTSQVGYIILSQFHSLVSLNLQEVRVCFDSQGGDIFFPSLNDRMLPFAWNERLVGWSKVSEFHALCTWSLPLRQADLFAGVDRPHTRMYIHSLPWQLQLGTNSLSLSISRELCATLGLGEEDFLGPCLILGCLGFFPVGIPLICLPQALKVINLLNDLCSLCLLLH